MREEPFGNDDFGSMVELLGFFCVRCSLGLGVLPKPYIPNVKPQTLAYPVGCWPSREPELQSFVQVLKLSAVADLQSRDLDFTPSTRVIGGAMRVEDRAVASDASKVLVGGRQGWQADDVRVADQSPPAHRYSGLHHEKRGP